MASTRVSSKGQVVIPKEVRDRHGWKAGTVLSIEDHADGVSLVSGPAVPRTTLADLIGCTGYRGPRRTLRQMDQAIAKAARQHK
jgi:AbrB family looped-hinge helix DNA binding protein